MANFPTLNTILKQLLKRSNNFLHKTQTIKSLYNNDSIENIKEYNETREFGYNRTICNAPNTSLYFNINGDVLACCKNTQDKLGNVKQAKLSDIWNSEARQNLIHKVEKYDLNGGCEFCNKMIQSKNYSAVLAKIYDQPFNASNTDFPADITFEISNACNLECIMCVGEYSSSIRKNREQLPAIPNNYPADFLEQLYPFLDKVKIIRLQGGEPFLINYYLEILEYINQHNKKCRIYIQTNGTVYNNRVKRILGNKNIHLSISIDSLIDKKYEVIRKNGNYLHLMDNLKNFTAISKKYGTTLNINFCLMKNNWEEIPALFEFCDKHNFSLNILPVDYPSIFSLNSLTENELARIVNHITDKTINAYKTKYAVIYDSLIQHLLSVKKETKNNEIELNNIFQFSIQELYSLLSAYLSRFLQAATVSEILDEYHNHLDRQEDETQKKILSKCIIHNRVLDNTESSLKYYDIRFKKELLDYFKYELHLLNDVS